MPFYAIAWFCYAPAYLANTPVGWATRKLWCRRRRLLVAFWCVLTLAMTALAIRMGPWRLVVPGEPMPQLASTLYYPVGAVDYLQQHQFRGNLLTPFDWGSYVSWKMHPQVKVSMDSRFEVAYPLWLEEEVFDFYMARQGWMGLLAKYPTDAVLVPTRTPVARHLPELAGWRRCYRDDSSEIYVRNRTTICRRSIRGDGSTWGRFRERLRNRLGETCQHCRAAPFHQPPLIYNSAGKSKPSLYIVARSRKGRKRVGKPHGVARAVQSGACARGYRRASRHGRKRTSTEEPDGKLA